MVPQIIKSQMQQPVLPEDLERIMSKIKIGVYIKIWWRDQAAPPAKYEYADAAIAEKHWQGFLQQTSIAEMAMYGNNLLIKQYRWTL